MIRATLIGLRQSISALNARGMFSPSLRGSDASVARDPQTSALGRDDEKVFERKRDEVLLFRFGQGRLRVVDHDGVLLDERAGERVERKCVADEEGRVALTRAREVRSCAAARRLRRARLEKTAARNSEMSDA